MTLAKWLRLESQSDQRLGCKGEASTHKARIQKLLDRRSTRTWLGSDCMYILYDNFWSHCFTETKIQMSDIKKTWNDCSAWHKELTSFFCTMKSPLASCGDHLDSGEKVVSRTRCLTYWGVWLVWAEMHTRPYLMRPGWLRGLETWWLVSTVIAGSEFTLDSVWEPG